MWSRSRSRRPRVAPEGNRSSGPTRSPTTRSRQPQDLGVLFPDDFAAGVTVTRDFLQDPVQAPQDTADVYEFQILQGGSYFFSLSGANLPDDVTLALMDSSGQSVPVDLDRRDPAHWPTRPRNLSADGQRLGSGPGGRHRLPTLPESRFGERQRTTLGLGPDARGRDPIQQRGAVSTRRRSRHAAGHATAAGDTPTRPVRHRRLPTPSTAGQARALTPSSPVTGPSHPETTIEVPSLSEDGTDVSGASSLGLVVLANSSVGGVSGFEGAQAGQPSSPSRPPAISPSSITTGLIVLGTSFPLPGHGEVGGGTPQGPEGVEEEMTTAEVARGDVVPLRLPDTVSWLTATVRELLVRRGDESPFGVETSRSPPRSHPSWRGRAGR